MGGDKESVVGFASIYSFRFRLWKIEVFSKGIKSKSSMNDEGQSKNTEIQIARVSDNYASEYSFELRDW